MFHFLAPLATLSPIIRFIGNIFRLIKLYHKPFDIYSDNSSKNILAPLYKITANDFVDGGLTL